VREDQVEMGSGELDVEFAPSVSSHDAGKQLEVTTTFSF
jgi:hypothetical protein